MVLSVQSWWFFFAWTIILRLSSAASNDAKRPNILFIFTDDQDLHMNSLDYMPSLQKHLIDEGTLFERHHCTVSVCCPSRANVFTGLFSHNTNVTDLYPPYGGYPKFIEGGFNSKYLPVWLQEAGYDTYYIGKFLNYHNIGNYDKPHLANWTQSDFLLEPGTYRYYNPIFQRNLEPYRNLSGQYSTDVISNLSLGFLDDATKEKDKPFFMTIAPIAPHADVHMQGGLKNGTWVSTAAKISSPVPARRHANLFNSTVVPRTPSFNPPEPNGVSWIATLPRQNQTNIDYNDEWYRNRLRALQSVDEMIDAVVTQLDKLDILDNTYIFYSTDNGFHIGQHRLQPSKQCAYKEDVNIPLIVRGPNVAKKATTRIITSHTDLAPTFLHLAGAQLREDFDGSVIPLHADDVSQAEKDGSMGELVTIEYWGVYNPEGKYGYTWQPNNTYKALRVVGGGYDLLYTVWCTHEHEIYDLTIDPYETRNLYRLYTEGNGTSNASTSAQPFATSAYGPSTNTNSTSMDRTQLVPRLDALTLVLKTCKADTCRDPWRVLHPQGDVQNLQQAMDPQYDAFYAKQPKVHFDECIQGYLLDNEMPLSAIPMENPERL